MLDCSNILAPTNEDLLCLAYDEGQLSTQSQAHFEQCPICQQRMATYIEMNELLREKLLYRLCPSALKLNFYCLGGVSDEERTQIASHLLDCPRCTEEVQQIRQIQADFDPFPESQPSSLASLRRIFANLVVQRAVPVTRSEAT
ncbi:MAG TPA: zf-HC2 domain-containing protein, partial [Ktedonobacteraceae bacterium]|nr:zf-HC2 domain-containing protein [Ktedonobacteraceae bacterium]